MFKYNKSKGSETIFWKKKKNRLILSTFIQNQLYKLQYQATNDRKN